MRTIISALLLASAAGGAAWAQDKPAGANSDAAAKPVEEKKVCRLVERTGSIMPAKSVCRKRGEWAQSDAENREAAEIARQSRPRTVAPAQFE
jgi:predicted secreted protein